MAETLKPCCEKARAAYVEHLLRSVQSYPVIKTIPCPTCRQVIPIRLYGPAESGKSSGAS